MRNRGFAVLFIALCMLFSPVRSFAGEINLSAAASLKDVLNELADGYAKGNPGVTFVRNYGASGAVAKQIENGAPADIFISASGEWIDYLKGKGMLDTASIGTFAYNTLVFVAPPGVKAAGLKDLTSLGKIAIGSPKSVPAGDYAMKALAKTELDKEIEGKLVMAKDVRECLTYAERGEVDGAFVYRTDAMLSRTAVLLFTVPPDLHPRVTYPMGLTAAGAKNAEARSFFDYLTGEAANATLLKYGFEVR
jgi:molybdate transport system substrate-binding protein